MSVYHNQLSSKPNSYLIERNAIFYFSIRHNGKLLRKSLYTDDKHIAQQIVKGVIQHRLFDGCTKDTLKAIVTEQIKTMSLAVIHGDQDTSPVLDETSHQSTSNTTSALTFPHALQNWINDKSSNLYQKTGGQPALKKTVNEKIGYLNYVFTFLWKNKSIREITSSDIDYALQVYSQTPKRSKAPWCNLNEEEQIKMAIHGDIPLEDRFTRSLHRVKTALWGLFDYYWRRNVIVHNPVKELRFRFEKTYNSRGKLPRRHTQKIVNYCLSKPRSPMAAAILIQLFGGLRNKEIEDLRPEDIKTYRGHRYIHVKGSKTKNAHRFVPVHPVLKDSGALDAFARDYANINSIQMTYFFKKLLMMLGLPDEDDYGQPLTFYSLRHTFATALAQSGASEIHIEWLMGHSHTGTKSKYIDKSIAHIPKLAATINKMSL